MKIKSFKQFLNEFEIEGEHQSSNIKQFVFESEEEYDSEIDTNYVQSHIKKSIDDDLTILKKVSRGCEVRVTHDKNGQNPIYIILDILISDENYKKQLGDLLSDLQDWAPHLQRISPLPKFNLREWSVD